MRQGLTTGLLKSIFSITPNNGFISRWTKYSFAWSFKLSAAVLRRLKLKKNYPVDVFFAAKEFESQLANLDVKKIKHDASKPRIILLGPYHFKQPMWSVRASAALPDLIEPLSQIAEVHLITPIPNAFALKDTSDLIQKYRIHHHLLEPNFNLKTIQHKGDILDSLINHIKPQVIMNTFGVSASGFDAVTCAKRNAIKSVLRVPGNEVLAREKILNNNSIQSSAEKKQQKTDLKKVNFAIQNSDKVLVMSSNDEQRIIQVR